MFKQMSLVKRFFFALLIGAGSIFAPKYTFAQSGADHGFAGLNSQQVEARVNQLLSELTPDEKIQLLAGDGYMATQPIDRLNIPALRMSDASVGIRVYGLATAYPASIALAATWDPQLAQLEGMAIGRDCLARDVQIVLGPGMNITREPQNGRNFEYLGEDPYLASQIAVGWIKGVQSQGVAACAKHYIGNEQEIDRMTVDDIIDRRTLEEIYLPPFRAAIQQAHVCYVMAAYNQVNGQYCTASQFLLTDILRKEFGFQGVVMSDWGAVHETLGPFTAGLDLEMPGDDFYNQAAIETLLETGQITQAMLDEHVRRILRTMVAMGFMDTKTDQPNIPYDDPMSAATALQVAAEGTVLLKNSNGILPLNASQIHTIVVVGPMATPAVTGGGGSSFTSPIRTPVDVVSAIEADVGPDVSVVDIPYNDLLTNVWGTGDIQTQEGNTGLYGEYFNDTDLLGPPKFTRVDKSINFKWNGTAPQKSDSTDKTGTSSKTSAATSTADVVNSTEDKTKLITTNNYSVRWTGQIKPSNTGDYFFVIGSSGGSRVYLDGDLIIDNWRPQSFTAQSAVEHLIAGQTYPLKIEYFSNSSSAQVQFGWVPVSSMELSDEDRLAISSADVVIACMGLGGFESEGRDHSYDLPAPQGWYLKLVGQANPHTIAVITAGAGVGMNEWLDQVAGLIYVWYPGENGNTALADILFGKIDPSGRLPDTFSKQWSDEPAFMNYPGDDHCVHFDEGIYVGYRWYDKKNIDPQFCFGYGLSYTNFSFGPLQVSSSGDGPNCVISVSESVTNTGNRSGDEVVQLYIRPPENSPIDRCVQTLQGFTRVSLDPGQSKTVELNLTWQSFACFNPATNAWEVPPGQYQIAVGSSSRDTPSTAVVQW
ncbi:MAG TPA: glycoside hydrolase family 3 N-terminal domain-containing protein [Phycisphaerae bacterium]|nr:glycoside hydrolase family 3 N-terminal domain-containing protein [Phycisphaerae bacterium]